MFFLSCSKSALEFNQEEKSILNIYKTNDTLVFKSQKTNTINHFVVTSSSDITENNGMSFQKNHISDILYISLENTSTSENTLIELSKSTSSSVLTVSFEGFHRGYPNKDLGKLYTKDTLELLNHKIINYNILYNIDNRRDEKDVIKIIWHSQYGILEYDLRNGESFIRTNIPSVIN